MAPRPWPDPPNPPDRGGAEPRVLFPSPPLPPPPGPRLVGLPPPWYPPRSPAVEDLRRRYLPRSLRDHGPLSPFQAVPVPVLGQADALRFLDDCARLGLRVAGMDFMGRPESGLPSVCHSVTLDAHPADAPDDSVALARAVVARGLPAGAYGVELVVVDPAAPLPPPAPDPPPTVRLVGGRDDGWVMRLHWVHDGAGAPVPPLELHTVPWDTGPTPSPDPRVERYTRDPAWRDHAQRGDPVPYRLAEAHPPDRQP